MRALIRDLRFGVRMLLKNSGFTLVAVLTLALGIGANTAIFSVVNAVLLRPLDYGEPERVVALWENVPAKGGRWRVAPANFLDWKGQNQVFEEVGAFGASTLNLTGEGEPAELQGSRVSEGYFGALGVRPALGRAFLAEEFEPGKGQVVILGQGLWRRRFGSDPNVLGKTVRLDGNAYTVVGVMPAGLYPTWPTTSKISFDAARQEYLVPMPFNPAWASNRNSHVLGVVARLKQGVTIERAQAEMDLIARRLEEAYPANNAGEGALVTPLAEEVVGDVRPALLVLLGTVGLVLLVACANVASLLLAQLAARRKEVAIRAALGAGRARLLRQFLIEGALLSLAGGASGVLLAAWGVDLLLKLMPGGVPRLDQIGLDARVLLFTLALSAFTSLVFGLVPALQASRADLRETLREAGRTAGAGPLRQRLRRLLVVAQVALAVVLVVGAALLIKSFWRLRRVDPGFNPAHVAVLSLSLPQSKYGDWQKISAFYTQLVERVQAVPGVRSATVAYDNPLTSNWLDSFNVEGRPEPEAGQTPVECFRPVGHEYFRTVGIGLVKGRYFEEQDDPSHPGAAIVNESFARKYFPGEDPLGKRLLTSTPARMSGGPVPTAFEIVGVVRDTKFKGLSAESAPAFYVPARQFPLSNMVVMARVEGDPEAYAQPLRDAVWGLDRDQPVNSVTTLEAIVAEDVAQPRFNMLLMGLFGGLALLLAAVGVYGLLSYTVAQRTREIGVRIALGARGRDIFRLALRQGVAPALAGVGVGLAAAFVLTRFLSSLLYGTGANDLTTYACVAALLTAVALLACYLPARRATKVDPMVALRYE
ncbi:MAG: ABC transporter permease [Acidobacteria bacterium]|nr:ABC transporter permease [Acidobacteriota bacterium]